MRHGQRLSYEELRDEAAAAVDQYAESQAAVARQLGVSRSAISRALKEAGPALAKLQREIIALLTDYEIEEEVDVTFRVQRKESS